MLKTEIFDNLSESIIRQDAIFAQLELYVADLMDSHRDTAFFEGLMYQITDIRHLTKSALDSLECVDAYERQNKFLNSNKKEEK